MSRLAALLAARPTPATAVPPALEQAWSWMEAQGWGHDGDHGYALTPYAGDRQLGVVFTPDASLDGWLEPGAEGADRLVPFVELDGSGSIGALWTDPTGQVRVVALGSEGEVGLLAESAEDFLRLVAIGYDEIGAFIDGPPEDEEAVEAHGDFRAWVQETFAAPVPEHWAFVDPDPFTTWVGEVTGTQYRSLGG